MPSVANLQPSIVLLHAGTKGLNYVEERDPAKDARKSNSDPVPSGLGSNSFGTQGTSFGLHVDGMIIPLHWGNYRSCEGRLESRAISMDCARVVSGIK